MTILENISLQPYNTFGLDVKAKKFVEVSSVEELREVYQNFAGEPVYILGGGSNVLFTKDYNGLVVRIHILGKEVIKQDEHHVWVKIGAGEVWHDFVLYAIKNGWAGVENMSLIPGTVGAAPMQNIGAYGVEIKQVFEELEAVDNTTGELQIFKNNECQFGYRSSIFKTSLKNKVTITSVTLRLNKEPNFNTSYGDIQKTLEANGVKELSLKAVSDAVIQIRQSKLPDPAKIGNAGSFFKNPEIPQEKFEKVQANFPEIPNYPSSIEGHIKVPAGWLIDQAGWKGKTCGEIGVHKNQALVLVNYGQGKGEDIWTLALEIQKSVVNKFGIDIIPEVNVI